MTQAAVPQWPPGERGGAGPAGTSLELFTGGGGLALALGEAGFHHLLTVEWEPRACATLRRNGARDVCPPVETPRPPPGWPLMEADVRQVDFTPWQGRVDVVAGGVPCQPWSLGGAHLGAGDARNLWPELFRCVRETRPAAVIAENVKGLLRPSFKPYYDYILREIEAPFEQRVAGEEWHDHDARLRKVLRSPGGDAAERYDVSFHVVNAADYGVPQVRWRVFAVAFRRDLGLAGWRFPHPTHSVAALLRDQGAGGGYWSRHGIAARHLSPPAAPRGGAAGTPAARERADPGPAHSPAAPESAGPEPAPGPAAPESAARGQAVTGNADGGPQTRLPWRTLRDALAGLPPPFGDKVEHPDWPDHVGWPGAREYPGHTPNDLDRPAKTVKAGVHGVPGGETVLRGDDGSLRYMTVREVARVMTFPDHWRLTGPRGERIRQLGNAVPVRLGHVVAEGVAGALRGTRPARPAGPGAC